MRFATQSGSIYEVDTKGKRARRVSGLHPGTERLGTDGKWRTYEDISPIESGQCVTFLWDQNTQPILIGSEPIAKMTITTPVVGVTP